MLRWILLGALVLPVVELFATLRLAAEIGWAWTVVWCLGAAAFGLTTARSEAAGVMRVAASQGAVGPDTLLEAGLVWLGGWLVAFPGVVTDVLGVVLLVPFLRRVAVRRLLSGGVRFAAFGSGRAAQPPDPEWQARRPSAPAEPPRKENPFSSPFD